MTVNPSTWSSSLNDLDAFWSCPVEPSGAQQSKCATIILPCINQYGDGSDGNDDNDATRWCNFDKNELFFTSWLEDAGHSVRGGWIELQKRKSIKGGEIVASFLIFSCLNFFFKKNKCGSSTYQISDIIQVSDNLGSDNALKVDFLKIQSPRFRGNFSRAFGMMVIYI